jgi:hypothetical protein
MQAGDIGTQVGHFPTASLARLERLSMRLSGDPARTSTACHE